MYGNYIDLYIYKERSIILHTIWGENGTLRNY